MAQTTEPPDDISRLRERHPEWFFTSVWAAAASGPDRRMLVAQRGAIVLSDFTAAALSRQIAREG